MTNTSIKIVRPWPAEQPRPPVTHRTDRIKDPRPRRRTASVHRGQNRLLPRP